MAKNEAELGPLGTRHIELPFSVAALGFGVHATLVVPGQGLTLRYQGSYLGVGEPDRHAGYVYQFLSRSASVAGGRGGWSWVVWSCYLGSSLDGEYLQDLVAVVVDDLDGDLAGLGRVEGAAGGGVQGRPGGFVDFGAEGALELVVGLAGAKEVGVADEEALAAVVGVEEPAGDVVGGAAADLAGGGVVDVQALDGDDDLAVRAGSG